MPNKGLFSLLRDVAYVTKARVIHVQRMQLPCYVVARSRQFDAAKGAVSRHSRLRALVMGAPWTAAPAGTAAAPAYPTGLKSPNIKVSFMTGCPYQIATKFVDCGRTVTSSQLEVLLKRFSLYWEAAMARPGAFKAAVALLVLSLVGSRTAGACLVVQSRAQGSEEP